MEVKHWQEAVDRLIASKIIFEQVQSYKDSLEAVVYDEKINQIDAFIGLCLFHLKLEASSS